MTHEKNTHKRVAGTEEKDWTLEILRGMVDNNEVYSGVKKSLNKTELIAAMVKAEMIAKETASDENDKPGSDQSTASETANEKSVDMKPEYESSLVRNKESDKLSSDDDLVIAFLNGTDKSKCLQVINGEACGSQDKEKEHFTLCKACNEAYGYLGRKVVSDRLSLLKTWGSDPEDRRNETVKLVKKLIRIAGDEAPGNKGLAEYMRLKPEKREGVDFPDYSDVPFGDMMTVVKDAREGIVKEKAAQRRNDRKRHIIEHVKVHAPDVNFPDAEKLVGQIPAHEGEEITEEVLRPICKALWDERWKAWKDEAFQYAKNFLRKDKPKGWVGVNKWTEDEVKKHPKLVFKGKCITHGMMRAAAISLNKEVEAENEERENEAKKVHNVFKSHLSSKSDQFLLNTKPPKEKPLSKREEKRLGFKYGSQS